MSRMENKVVMGYFAIEQKHHAAILSLVQPATPQHKMLDPCAGEGEFLEVAAQAEIVPPVAPRPGHTALVLAAGIADGAGAGGQKLNYYFFCPSAVKMDIVCEGARVRGGVLGANYCAPTGCWLGCTCEA